MDQLVHKFTLKELRSLAVGSGLWNYSQMSKKQLFDCLNSIDYLPFRLALTYYFTYSRIQDE